MTTPPRYQLAKGAVLTLTFVWFLLGGIGHFSATETFLAAVPGWVPWPREVVLATGAFEIAAALALLWPPARPFVGLALVAFCAAVTPVHVEMLLHKERWAQFPEAALWARLLWQPIYMALIFWATRR